MEVFCNYIEEEAKTLSYILPKANGTSNAGTMEKVW